MLTKLKQKIQRMLAAEAQAAHKIGLTPNTVTAAGFALSFLAAVAYALVSPAHPLWLFAGVVLLMASGFCDTLDGVLARTFEQATFFGGFLDSLLDRYADALVLAGIIISGAGASSIISPTLALITGLMALASSFMVSYSRARAEAAGIKMESIGIAERPERIIILALASLIAIFWFPALGIGVIVIALLATVTVLQRGIHVYNFFKKNQEQLTVTSSAKR